MTLITSNEKKYGSNQREVFNRFRLKICKGPSREDIRDAIGINISLRFKFSVPKEIEQKFSFLRVDGLGTSIYSLTWIEGTDGCHSDVCFLRGRFGPIQGFGITDYVYWGSFIAKYDVRKRTGDMSITLSYVHDIYQG